MCVCVCVYVYCIEICGNTRVKSNRIKEYYTIKLNNLAMVLIFLNLTLGTYFVYSYRNGFVLNRSSVCVRDYVYYIVIFIAVSNTDKVRTQTNIEALSKLLQTF